MPRIEALDPAIATGRTNELLDDVKTTFGATPNLFLTAAASDAALESMLRSFQAIGAGSLEPGFVEQIALAVSEVNGCSYCLSAHTYIGGLHEVPENELAAACQGHASDPKKEVALRFAQGITRERGAISDAEFARLGLAGWTDREIAEILAAVALTTFTNWFAIATEIEVDFPVVRAGEALAA